MAEAEDVHPWFIQLRRIIGECFDRTGISPDSHVLDVGCGTGGTMKNLAGRCRFTGLDVSELAADMAARISGQKVVVANASNMPFETNSFDAVVASHILEHIQNDDAAVQEIRRVLKPNGPLIALVPCHKYMFNHHDRSLHHVRRYSRQNFLGLLERNGFKPEKVVWTNPLMYPPTALTRVISRIGLIEKNIHRRQGSDTTHRLGPITPILSAFAAAEVWLMWRIPLPFGVGLLVIAR